MGLLVDTDLLPAADRADALQAVYEAARPRRTVTAGRGPLRHRVERRELGPGVQLLRTGGGPLVVERSVVQVRADAPEHVALGLHHRGRGWVSAGDDEVPLATGHLNITDMTRPYRLEHLTANDHDVLVLDTARLGVPVDVVRAARWSVAGSPVYPLVRTHLAGLWAATEGVAPDVAALTGQATVALVRALLTTAAGSSAAPGALGDVLGARIASWLEERLADPELSVEAAAAAHAVSVRHLYVVWARAGFDRTPARWVLDRRLRWARTLLETLPPGQGGITAVARRTGFADASHFSRRFREAFGTSPREWRETGRAGGATAVRPGLGGSPAVDVGEGAPWS